MFHEYVIPQALKKSSKLANGRYKLALEDDSKRETVEREKSRKQKLKLEEIANVKKNKLAVQETRVRALKSTLQKLKRKEISHYYQKLMLSEIQ